MLSKLPTEIIGHIENFLTRHDISQLTITCKSMYNKSIGYLYSHVELGHHIHMRQLQQGIALESSLKNTILKHTRKLTLRSRQNGNNWRIQDLKTIFGTGSKITTLIFCDFHALSTDMIQHTVSILHNLQHVQFQYCHLVYNPNQTMINNRRQCLGINNNSTFTNHLVNQVSFLWTDFTQKSIVFSLFPKITRLELGSNHNKYDTINGFMVQSLYEHCPHITHLTITLPQVSSSILCNTITKYGIQLEHLSIRCDNISTLTTITAHANKIKSLVIRVTSDDDDIDNAIMNLINACKSLQRFEIVSFHLYKHIPSIVWTYLGGKIAQQMLQKRLEQNDTETITYLQPSGRGSIWFYIISEEALQQRHNYMNSFPESKKPKELQTLILNHNDILNTRLVSPKQNDSFSDLILPKK